MHLPGIRLFTLVPLSLALLPAQTPPANAIVEGDIVNAAGNVALPAARVKIQLRQNEDPLYGKADPQGHFVFRDLRPGFYTVTIDAPGFLQSHAVIDVSTPRPTSARGAAGSVVVSVSGTQIPQPAVSKKVDDDGTIHATVTAPMLAYATIAGTVTDPYGEPLGNVRVQLWKQRPAFPAVAAASATAESAPIPQNSVTTNSRGDFRLPRVEPGTYWISASKPPGISTWAGNYHTTYYPAALDLASAQALKIDAGQEIRADVQIVRQAGVSVSGRLMGLPAEKTLVTTMSLVPANRDSGDVWFASAQDSFEFADILPGRYTLYARTVDALSDPINPNRKVLFGAVKDVEVGKQDAAGFDIALKPTQTLRGTVEAAAGCGSVASSIQLLGLSRMYFPVQAAIASDGTFTLENVPADRYTIRLWSTGPPPNSTIPMASATKGTRDVLKDGLESPWQDDRPLAIKALCPNQGGRR